MAVIPGFSDAGGCGRPPRFRTLVTGAHNCSRAALVLFPALQALHSATTDVPWFALAKSDRTCRARRLCFVVAICQTSKHDKWRKSFMICLEPSTRRGRKFELK